MKVVVGIYLSVFAAKQSEQGMAGSAYRYEWLEVDLPLTAIGSGTSGSHAVCSPSADVLEAPKLLRRS